MDVISQEEYYNRLFDLNEKYFKGKTELLDEYRQYEEEVYKGLKETQIKAIQEQIDALKSVNEEKQEEMYDLLVGLDAETVTNLLTDY